MDLSNINKRGVTDNIHSAMAKLKISLSNKSGLGESVAKIALTGESNATNTKIVTTAMNKVEDAIDTAMSAMQLDVKDVNPISMHLAQMAGTLSTDPMTVLRSDVPTLSAESSSYLGVETGNRVPRMTAENYNPRDVDDMSAYSVMFNLLGYETDEYHKAFFPMAEFSPNEAGISFLIDKEYIQPDITRDADEKMINFGRKTLTEATIDPTILETDTHMVVPVFRDGAGGTKDNSASFSTVLAPYDKPIDGEIIKTAPLKFGETVNLINISQTNKMLALGPGDSSDELDAKVELKTIVAKLDADVIGFSMSGIDRAEFVGTHRDSTQGLLLDLDTTDLVITKGTKTTAGTAITNADLLAEVIDKEWTLLIRVIASGSATINYGTVTPFINKFEPYALLNEDGEEEVIPAAIIALFDGVAADPSKIGYIVDASLSNSNHRERGDLIGCEQVREQYMVNLRERRSMIRPTNVENSSTDIQGLIKWNKVDMNHDAVRTVQEHADYMSVYTENYTNGTLSPRISGTGRHWLSTAYAFDEIDMALSTNLSSISSHEKAEDVGTFILQAINDMGTDLYVRGNYQGVLPTMTNPVNKLTLVVGCDPYLKSKVFEYVKTITNDLYDIELVSTPIITHRNVIRMMFRVDATGTDPCPITCGICAVTSELVFALPVGRGGQKSGELSVTGRWLNKILSPVIGQINVLNLGDAFRGDIH